MTRASDTAKLLGAGATILDGTTISTADNTAQLELVSTDADSGIGPHQVFYRNSSSPADADLLCELDFRGRNDNSQDVNYATINVKASDVSDGTEDGEYILQVMTAGSADTTMHIKPAEIVFNEDSIDRDFRVEGNGDANALFVEGETDNVGVGTNDPADKFHVYLGSGQRVARFESNDNTSAHIAFKAPNTSAMPTVGVKDEDLYFSTGDAVERMRISGGNICIGTTALPSNGTGHAGFETGQSNARTILQLGTTTTSQITVQRFYNPNGNVGEIKVSGTATIYATSSDHRLKENVASDWDATTRIKQLNPVRFNFIADADTTVDGFLAHEVQSVVPEAITGTHNEVKVWEEGEELPDGVSVGDNKLDDDGNTIPVYQGIDQSKLVPLLVKTIQELEARITTLENA